MNNSKYQNIPGKPAFQRVVSGISGSDFIKAKAVKTKFCNYFNCNNSPNANYNRYANQNDYIVMKNNFTTNTLCCGTSYIDKLAVNINLITTENLRGVNVVRLNKAPYSTNIDTTKTFLYNYTIDPSGQLFGNTLCGENNWKGRIQYNCV